MYRDERSGGGGVDRSIYQPGNLRPKFLQRLQSQQGHDQGGGFPAAAVQDLGWVAPAAPVVESPELLPEPRFVQRRRLMDEHTGDDRTIKKGLYWNVRFICHTRHLVHYTTQINLLSKFHRLYE